MDTNEYGYIIESDLIYPKNIHDYTDDYPLCPENIKITKDMLSDYQNELLKDLDMKFTPTNKLAYNLNDKTNYVCHITNLKYYLS